MPKFSDEQYSGRLEGHQLARHAMPTHTARGVDRVSAADQGFFFGVAFDRGCPEAFSAKFSVAVRSSARI